MSTDCPFDANALHRKMRELGYTTNSQTVELIELFAAALPKDDSFDRAFKRGDRVTKVSGASWTGKVVGFYSTSLTPEGYAVESETEAGSVQIYPVKALRAKE